MDYKNGKIYKLQINDGNFYIGSTKTDLRKRLYNHKTYSKTSLEQNVYKHIGENWENVKIILIENFPCNSRQELLKKENEYIQKEIKNDLCLNIRRSFRTEEEKQEYNKEYHKVNKEKIYEKKKEYTNKNKKKFIDYQKEYRESNKEKLKQKRKIRYEKSKLLKLE